MSSVFEDALQRLDAAFEYAQIDDEPLERLKHPRAMMQVSIPVRRDDGSLSIFQGYRVHHDETPAARPRAASASTPRSTSKRSRRWRCG